MKLALDVGSTYIEIYQEDLLIPELAKSAEDIHRELKMRIRQNGGPTIMLKELPPSPGRKTQEAIEYRLVLEEERDSIQPVWTARCFGG